MTAQQRFSVTTNKAGTVYEFEKFRVDSQRRILTGVSGEPIPLAPRVFDTLLYFVEHPGRLLGKQELIDAIWPNVVVEENSLNQAISTLRRTLGETRSQHRFIVTEPGRGYRFVAAVHAALAPDAGAEGAGIRREGIAGSLARKPRALGYVALAVAAGIALVGLVSYLRPDQHTLLPNSVAVLPLENLSSPENSIYADGLHVEIINKLSRVSNLNVIVRESVLRYAVNRPTLSEIAAELNVQSIMTGSFQYANGQIQVKVQLVDPTTSTPLWSNDYREDFADIFAVQADIAMNVANALSVEFSRAEQEAIATRPTASEAAYAAFLRSESLSEATGRSQLALEEINEAIRLDPQFALAHALKAQWYANALITVFGADAAAPSQWIELEQLVREAANRALELDPNAWVAHNALGTMHKSFWRWTDASREYELAAKTMPPGAGSRVDFALAAEDWLPLIRVQRRAVELNPNSALERWVLGLYHGYSGDPVGAADEFRAAIDREPSTPVPRVSLAFAETALGNDAAALRQLRAAEALGEGQTSMGLAILAYGYRRVGQASDARRIYNSFVGRQPDRRHHAGSWVLAYLAIDQQEDALEALEIVIDKIANEEPDAGYIALTMIRWNVFADPVLEQPRFAHLRTQLRGH